MRSRKIANALAAVAIVITMPLSAAAAPSGPAPICAGGACFVDAGGYRYTATAAADGKIRVAIQRIDRDAPLISASVGCIGHGHDSACSLIAGGRMYRFTDQGGPIRAAVTPPYDDGTMRAWLGKSTQV